MKNAIAIIAGVVVIAMCCFLAYLAQQEQLRKKELDKKMGDAIDLQREINKTVLEKLQSGHINLMMLNDDGKSMSFSKTPSTNGYKKKRDVTLTKEKKK